MKKVIGISGLPGSGKTLISTEAKKKGAIVVKMGDMVREEAKKRDEDSRVTAVKLREEHGKYAVAILTINRVKSIISDVGKSDTNLVIIEGIRSPYEVELFKDNFDDFEIISIFSSPKTRFKRLKERKRADDSEDFLEFKKRDDDELSFGIGNVIAESDMLIINETSLELYEKEIDSLLGKYF